jgi:hypothetical protein
MESITKEKSIEELTHIIKQINLSWREGHSERLKEYFHERMMIVSSDLKILGEGSEACIRSYSDFTKQVTLKKYSESEPEIHIWGNTAIASYKYDVAWEMNGKSFDESGKDLFVFTYENGKWLAVWRKLVPDKKGN